MKQRDDILGHAEKIKAEIAEINAKRLELEGRRTKADKDSQESNRRLLEL